MPLFTGNMALKNMDSSLAGSVLDWKFNLPYGGMVILVYKPFFASGDREGLMASNSDFSSQWDSKPSSAIK